VLFYFEWSCYFGLGLENLVLFTSLVFYLLVVPVRLSVPVQVIDWKDSSRKWPAACSDVDSCSCCSRRRVFSVTSPVVDAVVAVVWSAGELCLTSVGRAFTDVVEMRRQHSASSSSESEFPPPSSCVFHIHKQHIQLKWGSDKSAQTDANIARWL